ncbi:peptidase M23 [Streptomyces qinglanensis]|uniref:peptidase M23 n=1 Tax=Streptomyces qinglanensis TaxID=943816 RepID=UPI003D73F973
MDQREISQIAMQAAGVAKKGVMLKVAAICGVLFLVFLLIMGALGGPQVARAASCEDTGPGTGAAAPDAGGSAAASGSIHRQQIANAKKIDKVARRIGLPGKATLIALMTAMQESTLQNLDHGHADSIGLFQQRPSKNWGTKSQIMNPEYAATSFFSGRGGNKGLVAVKDWKTRPPGDVAQEVQNSQHPELYAGHESQVRKLAKEAGIDLGRKGSDKGKGSSGEQSDSDDGASGDIPSVCEDDTAPGPGESKGGTFSDGEETWTLHNPRSVKEAMTWARNHSGAHSSAKWKRACLAFVAIVYGWNASGVPYAIDHYTVVPSDMRHDGDRNPPPGALMYWDTGHRAGHVAIYLGHGQVVSNDIKRNGYIDIVKAEAFEEKWGARYIGWTPPVFPRGS